MKLLKLIIVTASLILIGCSSAPQQATEEYISLDPHKIYTFEIDGYLKVEGRGFFEDNGKLRIIGINGDVWDPIKVDRIRVIEE
jgi:hypothetical protein